VAAFLADVIKWSEIVGVVARVMDHYVPDALATVEDLIENDATARRHAHGIVRM